MISYLRLILFVSLIPIIIIGLVIYKNDKIEKESNKILIKVFCGGVLAVLITFLLGGFLGMLFPFFSVDNEANLNFITLIPYYLVGVALIEEFSKWLFVYLFCWKDNEFNYLYDAIVYCVFSALGFSAIENILYVLTGGIGIGIIRAVFSVPAHAFFAVFMGYYLGLSKVNNIKNNKTKSILYFMLSLIVPILLHFSYDYLLSIEINPILSYVMFLNFVILLYYFSIKLVKKVSKKGISVYNNN